MIRTQISFDTALYQQARKAAKRQRTSLAELCRRGLRRVLADETAEKPAYMDLLGSLSSGDENASASVDDVVYRRSEP
jgi:hypothetical protein